MQQTWCKSMHVQSPKCGLFREISKYIAQKHEGTSFKQAMSVKAQLNQSSNVCF